MKNKLRMLLGSSLVDYILPTALIGIVVGGGIYSIYDNGTLTKFMVASVGNGDINQGKLAFGTTGDDPSSAWNTNPNSSNNKNPPKTPSEPAPPAGVVCSSGTCSVTLGAYTLSGVPQDFSEFASTAGSSPDSLMEKMAALMNQIATQVEAEGDPDGIALAIRKFAAQFGGEPMETLAGKSYQYSGNEYLIEYLARIKAGEVDPDSKNRLTETGTNTYVDSRTGVEFDVSNPDTAFAELSMYLQLSDDAMLKKYDNLMDAIDTSSSGNDYSELKNLFTYFKDQGQDINATFVDQVSQDANTMKLENITNYQDVIDNIASTLEDVTAASILDAAKKK